MSMTAPAQSLETRYREYIALLKADGAMLTAYSCPSCHQPIETLRPRHGQFDSLTQCPHCERTHAKVVKTDGTVLVTRP